MSGRDEECEVLDLKKIIVRYAGLPLDWKSQ